MVISTVVVDFDVAGVVTSAAVVDDDVSVVVTSAAVVDVKISVVSSGNTAVGGGRTAEVNNPASYMYIKQEVLGPHRSPEKPV